MRFWFGSNRACAWLGRVGLWMMLGFLPLVATAANEAKAESADAPPDRLSPAVVQIEVMDFSDRFVTAIGAAMDGYIAVETDASKQVAARAWKVRYTSAAMMIAASRDPRSNLLDMVVFVSVGKWAASRHWVPGVFGEKAGALREAYREMDAEIWAIVRPVLSMKQQQDLRELIRRWQASNSSVNEVANVRLRNLDGVRLDVFDEGSAARGILASLQRFLGRVDTSLLYGERVMFYMERMPLILSQQTELTLAQIGEAFPIAAVKPEVLANAFTEFPAKLQAGIDANQQTLNTLLPQVATTLDSANTLALTLDRSLTSVREIASTTSQSGVLQQDPKALLQEASVTLSHLNATIVGLNHLLETNAAGEMKTTQIVSQMEAPAKRLMDAAFWQLIVLLAFIFVGAALLLVFAQFLFMPRRVSPSKGDDK